MKQKKIWVVLIISAVGIALVGSTAWAGSPQRHRWEGVAIGLGAALIGSTLWHHHHPYHHPRPEPFYRHPAPPPCNNWEVERVWIPPVYDSVWIPGHCNRWGEWMPGRWEKRVRIPGYWEERPYCSK